MSQKHIAARAPKPPMGWNSWDCFGVNVTEEEVKRNADFMAKHLKQYGWEYIVVDLDWYAPGVTTKTYKQPNIPQLIDDHGRLIPDPERFPSSAGGKGFAPLAKYVHDLGLKFGIHIMRGIPVQAVEAKSPILGTDGITADKISYDAERCPWYKSMWTLNFGMEETQAYYNSIFDLYSEWGVDYIKADDVNAWHEVDISSGSPTGEGSPYRVDDVEALAKAIDHCGRDMVLSISPGGPETTVINHLRNNTNLWRISADFWDEWGSLRKQMDRCATWAPFIKAGHWPDADMLPLGDLPRGESGGENRTTNFTKEEQRTVMTLWCMFRSPLMFGGNLPGCDDYTISLISNPEVLEVNQNSSNNRLFSQSEDTLIWEAQAADGGRYVALFNVSDTQKDLAIPTEAMKLLPSAEVRDLWEGKNLGTLSELSAQEVAAHGSRLFKIGGN